MGMRYFIALVLPPLAVLLCAKPFSALLNIVLTLLLYFPGAIHAVLVVHEYNQMLRDRKAEKSAERRHRELLKVSRF